MGKDYLKNEMIYWRVWTNNNVMRNVRRNRRVKFVYKLNYLFGYNLLNIVKSKEQKSCVLFQRKGGRSAVMTGLHRKFNGNELKRREYAEREEREPAGNWNER